MIIADAMKRGYKVALPIGEDWRYDIIVLNRGKLLKVQCKYTESDGRVVSVKCRSSNSWIEYKYTNQEVDWIAVYDKTSDKCYYIPSEMLGKKGRTEISLRLSRPRNNQKGNVRYAKDFLKF